MRMIDADALKEKAFGKRGGLIHTSDIDAMPTIEPKCGEWTPIHKGERGYSAGDFRCSVCHQPNKCYTMTNYCSHCGADMRSDK